MSEKKNFFRATAEDFQKIPGSPVAYWTCRNFRSHYADCKTIADYGDSKQGLITSDNNRFIRFWFETSLGKMGIKWFPHNKGGGFRRWYGCADYVVNWENNGYEILHFFDENGRLLSRPQNIQYFFRESITWNDVSTAPFCGRRVESGFTFDASGPSFFPFPGEDIRYYVLYFNTKVAQEYLSVISQGLHYSTGHIPTLPIIKFNLDLSCADVLVEMAKQDWNSYETSWGFKMNPFVSAWQNPVNPVKSVESNGSECICGLSALYVTLRRKWVADCEKMRQLETENNRIFIDAYGLQDELTPEVPWHEITLTCNPWYKYRKNKKKDKKTQEEDEDNAEQVLLTHEERELMTADTFPLRADKEDLLRCDTVKDLVSYVVGCMMGRYSLDKPGLILADQGASEADYYAKVGVDKSAAKFQVDEDGIIPILDNDWFADDIVTRFKAFIKVAFGEEHFLENMAWIEDALGKDIRSYFTKDFYKDHLQRYQNRPIYWLFQSPKGAFRALVYMHRYKSDMVGGVLGYLRSLQTKIDNQLGVAMQVGMDESKSASERVRANKDAVKYAKAKKELDEYERNVLYPLSTERIEIDLDDGVKVNYRKFGAALRKVTALEGKGE